MIGAPPTWHEAEIIARPRRGVEGDEPTLLVRRNITPILGPDGEDCLAFEGQSAITLFTGAGGMDLGLEAAGVCVLCQHELHAEACETLIANRPRAFRHAALIQGDIRRTPTSMILGAAGLRVGECAIVAGGPPCQGFSIANSNRRQDDPRNGLIYEFLRVVREASPAFFIFENVAGFPQMSQGRVLKSFLQSAHWSYYELVYGLIDCVEYGIPQYRCRFICMGTRRDVFELDGKLGSLPAPECFGKRDRGILAACDEEEERLLRHAPGIRYFPDRPLLFPPAPISHARDGDGERGRSKAFLDFYERLEREEPDRIVRQPVGVEAS